MAKQYGLILPDKGPKKPAPIFSAAKNVFGDDSDSDEEGKPAKPVVTAGERLKRQAQVLQNKALEEDPTVYQYDELYDDIEDQRKKAKTSVEKVEKKPRYIEKLLVAADRRKKDNERRVERQVQKEREEEGSKFADKESFVTSAYKKKLEEMRLEDEREKREKYLEEIGDVTKQADLGGFYRHLYEQKLQPEKIQARIEKYGDGSKPVVKEEKPETDSETETKEAEAVKDKKDTKDTKGKRTYRKRTHSESVAKENDSEIDEEVNRKNLQADKEQRVHMQSNIDADSDFSIDESGSSDEEDDSEAKKLKIDSKSKNTEAVDGTNAKKKNTKVAESKNTKDKDEKSVERKDGDVSMENKDEKDRKDDGDNFKKPDDVKVKKSEVEKEKEVVVEEVKPKIDIWKKRTVGEVFEQALQRYYERKAARGH